MARSLREDHPGRWWHLYDRGIAKRPVFETARDVEVFLGFIGAVVAAGLLEVHAFSVMTTHFHLVACSVAGEVSVAMRRILNPFVRWFNRSRKRDGSLFRGRFGGRAIEDWVYWETVLGYVDTNASQAGICALPTDHLYGSARAYRHGEGPEWLSRDVVERAVCGFANTSDFRPQDYDAFLAARDPVVDAHLVERLMACQSMPAPKYADLVRAASLRQQGWMEWKAALADGTVPGTAFVAPAAVIRAVETARRVLGRRARPAQRSDPVRDLRLSLLHDAAGLSITEVATAERVARSTVHDALRRHALRLADNGSYDELVSRLLRSAVRRTVPLCDHPFALPARIAKGADDPVLVRPAVARSV